jgi:tetratricopeptide (TPR) repeat protein
MDRPRALVIPFGVPDSGQGLGLGLASLVHAFARIEDGDVALAQIRKHGSDGGVTGVVEAFVTGAQWRAMPGAEDTPAYVSTIVTGAFEPPRDGRGAFSVLAFDAKTGEARCKFDAVLDADGAGRSIVGALASLCARVGGDVGKLRGLEGLGWDALESVIMAETWRVRALSGADPGGVVAALAHLGRAVSEARDATFPAERLATVAIEMARGPADERALEGALRALEGARDDSVSASLDAASAALSLRLGRVPEAIAHAEQAIERDAARAFPHALLAEARRARGDLAGANRAIAAAIALDENDPHVRNERAVLLLASGDALGARAEWSKLLASHAGHVAAFANLAALALEHGDVSLAQSVVDHALAIRANAPLDMLRRAVQVALQVEPASVARGSRLASLLRAVVEREPKDGVAALLYTRALAEMGERDAALERLAAVELTAKGTIVAAEAARVRLSIRDPLAAAAVDASIRAASEPGAHDFEAMATRARRLAEEHDSWVAHLAAAIAERRLGRLERAKNDALLALALVESAPLVHLELATIFLASNDPTTAMAHVKRALDLDPSSTRASELRDRIAEATTPKRASWIDRLRGK